MRLAFITSLLPAGQPDTGFEIANACILAALAEAGCSVVQFGFVRDTETRPPPPDAVVLDRIVIENAAASLGRKLAWLAASARLGLPVIATKLAVYGEARLNEAIASHGPFDGYVINSAPVAAAFPGLMAQRPSILVAHNVEHVSAAGNAAAAGVAGALLYRREAALLKTAELKAIADARFVWFLAEEDRQGFGIDISAKSAVLPLVLPTPTRLPDADPSFDIGLIGTWTWQPNLVGLRWFLDEVAPKLPADLTIAVAGRLPPGFGRAAANVTLLGRVPDANAFMASIRTVALTSRTGSGIQLKTIETFQLGKPAVATRSSVRGFTQLPTNCLVADDPAGFAAALSKLVNDVRSERTQIADGRAFATSQRRGLNAAVAQGLAALKS